MKEDEIAMKQKRLKAKEESNKKFDNLIKKSITGDKLESMKSQDLLRAQMQLAYKQGGSFETLRDKTSSSNGAAMYLFCSMRFLCYGSHVEFCRFCMFVVVKAKRT